MNDVLVGVSVATLWSSPEAPRAIDAAATADAPDAAAWAAALDVDARRDLGARVLTQALLGEPAQVVDETAEWIEVVLPWQPSSTDPRGYRGWMRHTHVVEGVVVPEAETAAVTTLAAMSGDRPITLSYGTVLPVVDVDEDVIHVSLPDGAHAAFSDGMALMPAVPAEPEALLASAGRFVGMQYLWGGTSGWGVDCSGFVHLVHRAAGIRVPRDAHDQEAAGTRVDLEDAGPGDLYFFSRPGERPYHVGFVTTSDGERTMLHAPESGAAVRVEDAPLAPERLATLSSAGTFLPR